MDDYAAAKSKILDILTNYAHMQGQERGKQIQNELEVEMNRPSGINVGMCLRTVLKELIREGKIAIPSALNVRDPGYVDSGSSKDWERGVLESYELGQ